MSGDLDQERIAAMTDPELWRLAEEIGLPAARWLPRAAIERGVLAIGRARRALVRAKETWRAFTEVTVPDTMTQPVTARARIAKTPIEAIARPSLKRTLKRGEGEPPSQPSDLPPGRLASETLARLYEDQGHPDKARRVRHLLSQRREAFVDLWLEPGALLARWQVVDTAWQRAERQLGSKGRRTVRLFVTAAGRAPESRDLPVEECDRSLRIEPPRGAFARAAVGVLADDGRFVPVAHSETVEV